MSVQKLLIGSAKRLLESIFPMGKHSNATRNITEEDLYKKINPTLEKEHVALMCYDDMIIKNFIYAIKYEKHIKSIRLAGIILQNYINEEIQEQELLRKMRFTLCTIPMTQERKEQNGYNHMHTILDEIHREIPADVIEDKRDLLQWTRHTKRQSHLKSRKERMENMKHAMKANECLPSNTICFVIDDVTTSGATLTEAKRALFGSGAETVITLALTHTNQGQQTLPNLISDIA